MSKRTKVGLFLSLSISPLVLMAWLLLLRGGLPAVASGPPPLFVTPNGSDRACTKSHPPTLGDAQGHVLVHMMASLTLAGEETALQPSRATPCRALPQCPTDQATWLSAHAHVGGRGRKEDEADFARFVLT